MKHILLVYLRNIENDFLYVSWVDMHSTTNNTNNHNKHKHKHKHELQPDLNFNLDLYFHLDI